MGYFVGLNKGGRTQHPISVFERSNVRVRVRVRPLLKCSSFCFVLLAESVSTSGGMAKTCLCSKQCSISPNIGWVKAEPLLIEAGWVAAAAAAVAAAVALATASSTAAAATDSASLEVMTSSMLRTSACTVEKIHGDGAPPSMSLIEHIQTGGPVCAVLYACCTVCVLYCMRAVLYACCTVCLLHSGR